MAKPTTSTHRGINRESNFLQEHYYHYFLRLYGRHLALFSLEKTGPIAGTYTCCLLRNHFHVLMPIKDLADLEDAFSASPYRTTGTVVHPELVEGPPLWNSCNSWHVLRPMVNITGR